MRCPPYLGVTLLLETPVKASLRRAELHLALYAFSSLHAAPAIASSGYDLMGYMRLEPAVICIVLASGQRTAPLVESRATLTRCTNLTFRLELGEASVLFNAVLHNLSKAFIYVSKLGVRH